MRLYLKEPEIGDLDGFTPENDLFGRKSTGAGLSYLLAQVEDPVVLALDAQWGAGKSVFLRQWAGELRKAGYPVVLFDAFKHDYAEDAFTALAGEIMALVEERKKERTPEAVRLQQKAIQALKVIGRPALKALVKIATMNVVDTEELGKEAAKIIGDEAASLEDRYIGELITRQKESQGAIEEFRSALAELPALLGPEGAPKDRPLVFIIDELDRCRPHFALEVLERIKHFFSVRNVHFVLGVHLAQLRNSIVAAYGAEMDASAYLQKFIHFSVRLDDASPNEHERHRPIAVQRLRKQLELGGVGEQYTELILHVAEGRGLSLRTIEKIFTVVALSQAFAKGIGSAPAPDGILAGLCIMKVTDPDLYEAARYGGLPWDHISRALCFDSSHSMAHGVAWSAKAWAYTTAAGPLDQSDLNHLQSVMGHRPRNDGKLFPLLIRRYIDRIERVG